jgi:hypothetical protein
LGWLYYFYQHISRIKFITLFVFQYFNIVAHLLI